LPAHRRVAARVGTSAAVACLLAALSSGSVYAAANTVPPTKATRFVVAISANTLKPSSCAAITLATKVVGVTGTTGNDLLVGTANADTMSAGGGNDCVLGGGGNDTIDGGTGTDVCIGGPGTDVFTNCETQVQ
jgi:hypothetical protein